MTTETWTQVPATVHLVLIAGDDAAIVIDVLEDGVPIVWAGATVDAAVYARRSDTSPLVELPVTAPTNGELHVTASDTVTAALVGGPFVWRARATRGTNTRTVVSGRCTIHPITHVT